VGVRSLAIAGLFAIGITGIAEAQAISLEEEYQPTGGGRVTGRASYGRFRQLLSSGNLFVLFVPSSLREEQALQRTTSASKHRLYARDG
jgi:hypothetical protein